MNKGFTLLETLAVIVILVIIALIAIPIVLNIIKEAQDAADKRSLELFVKIMKTDYLEKKINNSKLNLNSYMANYASRTIYDGNKIVCEYYNIIDNDIELFNCIIGERKYYNYINRKVTKTSKKIEQENDIGKVVYFDVSLGKGCSSTQYKEANSEIGYNGINPNENQTSCLKFYKIGQMDDKINLLLDHNLNSSVQWYEYGLMPDIYPYTVLKSLNDLTDSWNITENLGIYKNVNHGYEIDYTGYKARLITAQEIALIIGDTLFDEATSVEGFSIPLKYSWLYEGGNYWTATAKAGDMIYSSNLSPTSNKIYFYYNSAWAIVDDSLLNDFSENLGVRPVITISNK